MRIKGSMKKTMRWTGLLTCGWMMLGVAVAMGQVGRAPVGPVDQAHGQVGEVPAGREMPQDEIHGVQLAKVETHAAPGVGERGLAGEGATGDDRMEANAPVAVEGAAREAFERAVDVRPLELVIVQDQQTLKTLDTFSRQAMSEMTGRSTVDGQRAVYTVLDIMFRPDAYRNREIIHIKNAPLRRDFSGAKFLDEARRQRIIQTGMMSFAEFADGQMQKYLSDQGAEAAFKQQAVQQVMVAAGRMNLLLQPDLRAMTMIPPGATGDQHWHTLGEMQGNIPASVYELSLMGRQVPPALAGYEGKEQLLDDVLITLMGDLKGAWLRADASGANVAIAKLAGLLPEINPAVYPSETKRKVEVYYNRLAMLTIPGAAVYFIAFVCFLVAARSGFVGVRLWGLRIFMVALVIHTAAIGIRWWLAVSSVGNWFEAIPIKNQFESVMFSAWFGAMVGMILELRKSRGVFGAAASFVGWMSLTAIIAVPFVVGRDIGGQMGQVAGVLMSYWLYIHVTMVTAAYALIGMSFALGVWWLVKYYADYGTLGRLPAAQLSADAAERASTNARAQKILRKQGKKGLGGGEYPAGVGGISGGGAAVAGFWRTLGQALFVKSSRQPTVKSGSAKDNAVQTSAALAAELNEPRSFLAALDQCNLVILQLAFWVLGVGIVLGAVWADQSWGRPWGWDPKETFALVTWIVYLVVVHVRVATENKAWWTAVLSIVGFGIMLFNWIGVNYFLVGLHSYA